jgi:hypothetical protein
MTTLDILPGSGQIVAAEGGELSTAAVVREKDPNESI